MALKSISIACRALLIFCSVIGTGEFKSILSLDTNKISGDDSHAYGILFGEKKNLKRFFIYGTGKYALGEERFKDSKLINKTGKLTFSPHIQKGNSKNTLKVEFHGKMQSSWSMGISWRLSHTSLG